MAVICVTAAGKLLFLGPADSYKVSTMTQTVILLPMMALVGWTLAVLLLIPYQRFKAAYAGQISANDFKFGESATVPTVVSIPNRNFMNLLEAPVLFYALSLTFFVTQQATPLAVNLAWGYFSLRVLHSMVHLSYNKVTHRLIFFAASNVLLTLLWIQLFIVLFH